MPNEIKGLITEIVEIADSNPHDALPGTDQLLTMASDVNDLWVNSISYSVKAYVLAESGQSNLAYVNYLKALKLLKESDTIDLANEAVIYDGLSLTHFY